MAFYEYKCKTCASTFELRRSMSEADAPAACPDGHLNSVRLLSVFAATGISASGGSAPAPMPSGGGGGCGGHCACH
jgi:putative FmdB family regulatory protein